MEKIIMVKDLCETIKVSVIFIVITFIYLKMVKFEDEDIKISKNKKSLICVFLVVSTYIIITFVYDLKFRSIFPINSITRNFILRLILSIVPIALIILNRESFNTIGISRKNILKSIISGFILGILYVIIYIIVCHLNVQYIIKNINFKILIHGSIYLFVVFIIVGFSEEFVYRGYVQTRLMINFGNIKGWVLASIIFAYMHVPESIFLSNQTLIESVLVCSFKLPISLLFGYIYMKTKNIYSGTIVHSFVDWIQTLICCIMS